MEQFANLCSTTVGGGGYTAGSGVLDVGSTAAPWPQSPCFRVLVLDAATKAVKVILKVTGVASETQWQVTAEGADADAAVGDEVQGTMLTADVMTQLRSEIRAGGWFDVPFTPPDTAGFSWVNQGGATITQKPSGAPIMYAPGNAGDSHRMFLQAVPGVPYTLTIACLITGTLTNWYHGGIYLRDSASGKAIMFGPVWDGGLKLQVFKLNGPTSYNSGYYNVAQERGLLFLRIQDDGTNRICTFSNDGESFAFVHTVGRTDWITPNQIGWGVNSNNSRPAYNKLFHWSLTTP